jgi:hypothetical protein
LLTDVSVASWTRVAWTKSSRTASEWLPFEGELPPVGTEALSLVRFDGVVAMSLSLG